MKELFATALLLAADVRQAHIDQVCSGDEALRDQVKQLLASHEHAHSFLERSPRLPADETLSSILEGRRIGPYELSMRIGAGGMDEVYKARDTRLDRTVAIKVLPPHIADDPVARDRFEREARAVAALNHPHICMLHDIGTVEGLDFLVMEYLEGETLASRLAKGALSFGQTIQYGIQIASALDAVHRAGIVHRDLKPSNIVLTKSGAKLLDFGLSKATALVAGGASTLPDWLALTSAGIILGTLQYMAPEQLDRSADSRSDIFSVGAVFYEMITGKKAFNGDSHSSLTTAIREYEPSPMSGVPLRVERVIRACLAKDPDDRWQTARDLVRELAWTSDGEADSRDAASQAIIRKARVMAWGSAAAAIALVSAVAAVAFWYLPRVRPNPTVVRFDVLTPTEVQTGYIGNRTNREHG